MGKTGTRRSRSPRATTPRSADAARPSATFRRRDLVEGSGGTGPWREGELVAAHAGGADYLAVLIALVGSLVDLLIQLVHRIGVRAERRVERELFEDLKRVNGKTNILFRMAEAAWLLLDPVFFVPQE